MRTALLGLMLVLLLAAMAHGGANGSLLKTGKSAPPPVVNDKGEEIAAGMTPTLKSTSLIAVAKAEPKTFEVHDIITIIVREESNSKSEAEASAKKSLTATADIKEWIKLRDMRLIPDDGITALNPKVDVSMDSESKGEGETERKDSFLTKIAATVIDVKPNGNLVLEAKRFIKSDDEEITMTLSGTARSADVDFSNSVYSTDIADLAVTKTTAGIARDGQKRGWLTWLLHKINPF